MADQIFREKHGGAYYSFDDPSTLMAAKQDPMGFLAGLSDLCVLDEIQRAPELYLPLKYYVDQDRRPGRFIITGSTSSLFLPKLSDAMVGRMEIHTLHPFSQRELMGKKGSFIDWCFSSGDVKPNRHSRQESDRDTIQNLICKGGYPEPLKRASVARAKHWFSSYINTVLNREVQTVADIEGLNELPRLLKLLAARVGSLGNYSELSRATGVPLSTLKRYLAVLKATFIYEPLTPWFSNIGKRLVKSPKIYLNDTGIACHLLEITENPLSHPAGGKLLENFVFNELAKQATWSDTACSIFHYRTHDGEEVDFLLEAARDELVAIEVKSSATLKPADYKGLLTLAATLKHKLRRGIILYLGTNVIPLGKNLHAVPLSSLWQYNL